MLGSLLLPSCKKGVDPTHGFFGLIEAWQTALLAAVCVLLCVLSVSSNKSPLRFFLVLEEFQL